VFLTALRLYDLFHSSSLMNSATILVVERREGKGGVEGGGKGERGRWVVDAKRVEEALEKLGGRKKEKEKGKKKRHLLPLAFPCHSPLSDVPSILMFRTPSATKSGRGRREEGKKEKKKERKKKKGGLILPPFSSPLKPGAGPRTIRTADLESISTPAPKRRRKNPCAMTERSRERIGKGGGKEGGREKKGRVHDYVDSVEYLHLFIPAFGIRWILIRPSEVLGDREVGWVSGATYRTMNRVGEKKKEGEGMGKGKKGGKKGEVSMVHA